LPRINKDEFTIDVSCYFDEELMKWVTDRIVFTNDGIKKHKSTGYAFVDRIFDTNFYNPSMFLAKLIGNKFFYVNRTFFIN
jgi:hypothetical protein